MNSATAPDVPPEFWMDQEVQDALTSRHMGRVIRAFRQHPMHGRRAVPQEEVAAWAGLSQGQLSRLETGPPVVHLDRLVQWARLLRIPQRHLWFAFPPDGDPSRAPNEELVVRRSEFLAWTGAMVSGVAAAPLNVSWAYSDVEACARALAWELWRSGEDGLHGSQLPAPLAAVLARVAVIPWDEAQHVASTVVCDIGTLPADRISDLAVRFAAELSNHNDSAARWCATLVLAKTGEAGASVAYPALRTALSREPCMETLRGVAAALSGQNPITI